MANQSNPSSSSRLEFSKSITSFHGETEIIVQKFKYIWVIKNFDDCYLEKGESVYSPVYSAYCDEINYEFTIHLYPNGILEFLDDEPYVELVPIETSKKKVFVKIHIINCEGKPLKHNSGKHVDLAKPATLDHNIKNFKDHTVNGNLIIQMEMYFKGENDVSAANPSATLDVITSFENRSLELNDFEKLFESGEFSDLTLTVGTQEYYVHKCILSTRSPVFQAMFKHDTKENQENTLNIPDIEPRVMEELLRFIYAGKVAKIDSLNTDLFLAADKYGITRLKDACETTLIYNLSLDNVGNALTLMDHCETDKLKPIVMEFITNNSKALKNNEDFKKIMNKLSPSLLTNVIGVMLSKL